MTDLHKENRDKVNGRWTKEQHQKFIKGLEIFGKDWKKIEAFIGTRNGAQIRSHAQKYFIKIKKPTDNQHSEHEEHSIPENNTMLSQQSRITDESQEQNQYSCYLTQIVEKTLFESETFDFWTNFIDHKKIQNEQIPYPKRKDSFVSLSDKHETESIFSERQVKVE